jgi:hypothetical protein
MIQKMEYLIIKESLNRLYDTIKQYIFTSTKTTKSNDCVRRTFINKSIEWLNNGR